MTKCPDSKWQRLKLRFTQNLDQINTKNDSLSNLKNITVIKLYKNKGPSFCRNYAMRISKSKCISFIDSDDGWEQDKLEKQISFMEKNNFLRDENSKALINNNRNALQAYKVSRNRLNTAKQDIEFIKNELQEQRKMITELQKKLSILTKDGEE